MAHNWCAKKMLDYTSGSTFRATWQKRSILTCVSKKLTQIYKVNRRYAVNNK